MIHSAGEGFGIAYLEAMACGTPAPGARDVLADGELGAGNRTRVAIAGLLVAPRRDTAELSHAVRARFGRKMFQACVGMALEEYRPRHKRPRQFAKTRFIERKPARRVIQLSQEPE